jgi:vesicle coat complex subunit
MVFGVLLHHIATEICHINVSLKQLVYIYLLNNQNKKEKKEARKK